MIGTTRAWSPKLIPTAFPVPTSFDIDESVGYVEINGEPILRGRIMSKPFRPKYDTSNSSIEEIEETPTERQYNLEE